MLPSKGYFRGYKCPFSELDMCERPFCHYNHSKSLKLLDNWYPSTSYTSGYDVENKIVSYSPTPLAILEQYKINKCIPSDQEIVYTPTKIKTLEQNNTISDKNEIKIKCTENKKVSSTEIDKDSSLKLKKYSSDKNKSREYKEKSESKSSKRSSSKHSEKDNSKSKKHKSKSSTRSSSGSSNNNNNNNSSKKTNNSNNTGINNNSSSSSSKNKDSSIVTTSKKDSDTKTQQTTEKLKQNNNSNSITKSNQHDVIPSVSVLFDNDDDNNKVTNSLVVNNSSKITSLTSSKIRIAHKNSKNVNRCPKIKPISVPNPALVMANRYKLLKTEPVRPVVTETVCNKPIVEGIKQRIAHVPKVTPPLKLPMVLEAGNSKIPIYIRNQFLRLIFTECQKLYNKNDDVENRALTEELNCFKKCLSIRTYKNSAMLIVNKLRKEANSGSVSNSFDSNESSEHDLMYRNLSKWLLSESELIENGFPRLGTGKNEPVTFKTRKVIEKIPESHKRCARCSKIYMIDKDGYPAVREDCIYHPLRRFTSRGESRYGCCQQSSLVDGCCVCSTHVYDDLNPEDLRKFVKISKSSSSSSSSSSRRKIYALDCEMIYTTRGIELARVTVVDTNCKVTFDSLVLPTGRVLDYNTRFSGITEELMNTANKTFTDIQSMLLKMFNSKTILIGHSLESDLKAMRLIHDTVIDTSVLFPHRNGPPFKRGLRTLASDYLQKIIQNDVAGHDSSEDAVTCMELILWKLKQIT